MKRNTLNTLFGAMLATLALGAQAETMFLDALLNGGSLTQGDKTFDSWTLIDPDGTGPLTGHFASDGRTFNPSRISVKGIGDGVTSDYGLQFSVSNGELDVIGDDVFAYVDLHFGFRVTVTDPSMRIVGASLGGNSGFMSSSTGLNDGSNDNGMYIRETLGSNAGQDDVGTMKSEWSLLDDVFTDLTSDFVNFAPRTDVWVTKNILVWASESTDSAGLMGFTQTFAQRSVPEPATLALFGLGLLGLGLARRRG